MHRRFLETDQTQCFAQNGQTIPCCNSGQDASFEKNRQSSIRRRFHVLDHVIADKFTGANWTKDANAVDFPLTWNEALAYVADMRENRVYGHDNWQLPSRGLLFSLISHQEINPALPDGNPFENVFTGYYWTGDSCCRLPDQAWYVHLGGGRVHRGIKQGSYLVWPVSMGNMEMGDPGHIGKARFRTTDDTCIHDVHTGLTWSQDANPAGHPLNWQEALSMVDAFNRGKLGGHRDWRLPNVRELESLVDLDSHSPALPTGHPFVNVKDVYWSSTTSVYEPRYAWTLYSREGIVGVGFKLHGGFYAWPVRKT